MDVGATQSPSALKDTTPSPPGEDQCARHQLWDTHHGCRIRELLDQIANKRSMTVIALLHGRTLRSSELSREANGITPRVLTHTLRQLERDGLVSRTVHPVVPPRVEYQLTPLGVSLYETFNVLVAWGERHEAEITAARTAYDHRIAARRSS